jgi:programmed cell death 6-interacting protein
MLAIPLKRSAKVDLVKPLAAYIEAEYSDGENHDQSLESLQQLRVDATTNVMAATDSSRKLLYKYYQQLIYAEKRFPVSETKIKLSFTWFDAFKPSRKIVMYSLAYEQASILFNAAALESHAGVQQDRSNGEGLVAACAHFKKAAGIFLHLKENVCGKLMGNLTSDLTGDGLNLLKHVMLAQAQACYYEKAVKDKMKNAIIAKLAAQASEFYNQSLEASRTPTLVATMDKSWGYHLEFQVHCFNAASQYWQSIFSKAEAEKVGTGYGEEIARLVLAEASCAQAIGIVKKGSLPSQIQETVVQLQALVLKNKTAAVKDNNTIYMEQIPTPEKLAQIAKASLVQPSPMPDTSESAGEDLFKELIPMEIHLAASMYSDRTTELRKAYAERVQKNNDLVRSRLASIGLPASIEAHENGTGLPTGVWHKVRACQDRGGQQKLRDVVLQNHSSNAGCYEVLGAIEKQLAEEETEDCACRTQYGSNWERPASSQLNDSFRGKIDQFYSLLKEAKASDVSVDQKLNVHEGGLGELALSRHELDASIPENSESSSPVDTSTLSQLLVQMGNIIGGRDEALKQLTAEIGREHILSVLMKSAGVLEDEQEAIFSRELAKFAPLQQKIDEAVSKQTPLMDRVLAANAEFDEARGANEAIKQRQAIIERLEDAVATFDELYTNMSEGNQFYSDLATRVRTMSQEVVDHCSARSMQKQVCGSVVCTPRIHSSHTLLAYTPRIHSSHTLLAYTPRIHSSHTLLSYTGTYPIFHYRGEAAGAGDR